MMWSFTAILSYSTYQFNPVQEILWLEGAGYIFVIAYAYLELKKKKQPIQQSKI